MSTDVVAVRAAGGLVIRDHDGLVEVAIVHRPRYDDWTIPKGKLDPGEEPRACALREVEEETGYRCQIIGRGGTTRYRVSEGLKEVDYFLMRPIRYTGFTPNEEVDIVRWFPTEAARKWLTYDFDRRLLYELDESRALAHTAIHLVRHAQAGDRGGPGDQDHERPLSEEGFSQASALAAALEQIGIKRVLSSPYVRCVQTVVPLAERLGVEVELHGSLAEGADPDDVAHLLGEVAGSAAVLCSHGDVVPIALHHLQQSGVRILSDREWKKGSTWVVCHDSQTYTEAAYIPPPEV